MLILRIAYIVTLIVYVAITYFLANGGGALALLYTTFGLGAPLLFAPSFLPNFLFLGPLVFAGKSRIAVTLSAALFVAASFAWAIGPSLLGAYKADQLAAEVAAGDFGRDVMRSARTAEIRQTVEAEIRSGKPVESLACAQDCIDLLNSGFLWVRTKNAVSGVIAKKLDVPLVVVTYVASATDCVPIHIRLNGGKCAVVIARKPSAADVSLQYETLPLKSPATRLMKPVDIRVLTVRSPAGGVVAKLTMLNAEIPSVPALIAAVPEFGGNGGGLEILLRNRYQSPPSAVNALLKRG